MSEAQLQYEDQMFVELLSEDGLTITARGIGLDRLFVKFLKLYSDPHTLVLVVNTSPAHEEHFINELVREGVELLPRQVTNEITAKEREVLYLKGGVLFITSRILVVDLLRKQCPAESVSGILVFNAHRVTDSSTEAFILRLYRERNKTGFIKGFSDAPEQFTTGFCQLERVVKHLFVRKVYLWPRFQAVVSASLEKHKPDVVELRQQMTPCMTAIQMAILEVMKACVTELKSGNPLLDIDEVTVENCLGKMFDQIVKMHLDPVWNQLSTKTRNLVFDLKMLRTLLHFLTQYDCVTFFSYLESLRLGGARAFSNQSPWIFMDAANALFVRARERVYGQSTESTGRQQLTLEESPKWHLLSMVLEEVKKEFSDNAALGGAGKVLVVANDDRTCYQLRQFLCEGGRKLLLRQFERLLAKQKTAIAALPEEMQKQLQSGSKRGGRQGPTASKKGSRRVQGEPAAKKLRGAGTIQKEEEEEEGESSEHLCEEQARAEGVLPVVVEEETPVILPVDEGLSDFSVLPDPLVVLHPLTGSDNPGHLTEVLHDLQPRFIIMYDADVKFVRQVEVFKASHPGVPLRVYFLVYDSSVEEQKYLTSLRREKDAFHQLIREKAHMVVPHDSSEVVEKETQLTHPPLSSRKAGGRAQDSGPQTVVVDMREFRSSLPSLLHKRGMDIMPVTLEVGDYVLSPDMCVERKSISDLIGSLNSGRLFNQVTAMSRYYRRPILLIECEEGKPFTLQQGSGIMHSEISAQSVSSKLVLLTLHFPKLRLLWCPNSHCTAELFQQLKVSHPQPDPEVAAGVGAEREGGEAEEVFYSAAAQDFLLKLPGINTKNCRLVMNKVRDLQELVSLSEDQLGKVLDNDTAASLLWGFLHQHQSTSSKQRTATTSSGRGRGSGRGSGRGRGQHQKRTRNH